VSLLTQRTSLLLSIHKAPQLPLLLRRVDQGLAKLLVRLAPIREHCRCLVIQFWGCVPDGVGSTVLDAAVSGEAAVGSLTKLFRVQTPKTR